MTVMLSRVNTAVLSIVVLLVGFLSMPPSTSALMTEFGAVEIVVTDQIGTPISNANLCLAMPGQSLQKMTDSTGSYKTSLPVGTTTIHVSRSGYANAQATVTMTKGANLVQQVQLQQGQSTPLPSDCGGIAGTTIPGNSCDVINNLAVAGGTTTTNRALSIVVGFDNRPAYYRVTEFSAAERYPESQFNPDEAFKKKNVPWQPVTSPGLNVNFALTEPGYGTHHVYIQTKRYQSGCISSPRVVSVVLAPASVQSYVLTGEALNRFVAEAKRKGYQFTHRFTFRKKDGFWKDCGPNEMREPKYPRLAQRQLSPAREIVDERIEADFEIFSGPDLQPFWEFQYARALHPDLPAIGDGGGVVGDGNIPGKPALEFEKFSDISCPYCTAQDVKNLHRRLEWTRQMWRTGIPSSPNDDEKLTVCKPRTLREPWLIQLRIRGPAGEDPINALPPSPLQLRPLSEQHRFQQFQKNPPPQIILPRGVEEQEGTEAGTSPVETTEPDKKP